jgi:predicted MFS family arabinose efflux permease
MRSLLTRSFVSLLLAQTSFAFGFASFFLLPKYLTIELAAGPVEIGAVMGVFGVTSVVAIPLVGALVDRLGRRRFMTAGALLMAATALAFRAAHEVGPLLYGLRMLQGVAFAMTFISSSTLVTDEAPPERLGQALGLFGVSMLSMHALAPAAAEEIAGHFGWNAVFGVASVAAAACALLTRAVREPAPPPRESEPVSSFWDVARRPRSLRIATVTALSGAAFGAMLTYSQPFALELGRSQVRGFFLAYAGAAVAVRLGLGSAADRLGRERVSVASLAVYAAVVLAMADLWPGGLEPLGALFGLAHGLFYPAFNALAVETAGPHERGKLMALYNGAFNVGNSGATLALGFVAERQGYPAVFLLAGFGVLLGLALLALSPEGRAARVLEAAP